MAAILINSNWEHGELSALAELSGVSESHLSHVVAQKQGVSGVNAIKLAKACEVLKIDISLRDWLQSKTSSHPRFGRRPSQESE